MARYLKVAAAQMGPNQEGTPRDAIVERMLALLEAAARDGVELIVYPETLRKRWNFLGRRQPQHYGEMLKPVTEKEPHR